MISRYLIKAWYQKNLTVLTFLLLPFSYLFRIITFFRRLAYRVGLFKVTTLSAPVIVVGNITVGGTGKTPFVIWLVDSLKKKGLKPGIVSRGYGANIKAAVLLNENHSVKDVGDEAFMMYQKTKLPVVVCPDRVKAAKHLLNETDCNIIVSDDGLQHYALGRDLEIVMVDGDRELGNAHCLPAGPLREPVSRLKNVDFTVLNTSKPTTGLVTMELQPDALMSIIKPGKKLAATALRGQTVHAVAGIGNPKRFFESLKKIGLTVREHPFPDHHQFKQSDIQFDDKLNVVMTEKDAVKCQSFADKKHYAVSVKAKLPDEFSGLLFYKIDELMKE